ncbi:ubiquitin carboxyl-terminal hydrolase 8 [Monosporozyma servazzii]
MTHCPHFSLLLSSDKRLLKNYDLIKRTIIFNESIPYKDKMLYTMKCHICHEFNAGTNFLCLHCSFSGCWESKHFESHSREHSHPFGINAMNGLLFCISCEDYIIDDEIMAFDGSLTEEWPTILDKSHPPDQIRREGLYGLVNMGSTCFMSSVLQTLVHDKYIVRDFIGQDHVTHCSIKDPKMCMSCALDRIISECYGSVSKTNDHGGFLSLLTCVWSINKNYAGYSQQDAHEFLQFILNQLHNDYMRIHPKEDQQQLSFANGNGHGGKSLPGDNNNSIYKKCSCIVHSTFRGTLKSSIVCSECNDNSKSIIEPYMDLSLDIKGKKTLYDCLDSFHKKEQLRDFDYHCPHCQTTKDPIKQLTIDRLSPILIFQLKRFEHLMNGNNIKLNDFVEFPLYLKMNNYCDDNSNSKDTTDATTPDIFYELVGIISHQGTVNEGHYTATLKLPSGQWFKFNDSMISLLKEEQVLKEQAYLLFFTVKQINTI